MISEEQMSVVLTGIDDNLWWERLRDMIKHCDFYKCWDSSGVLLKEYLQHCHVVIRSTWKGIITFKDDSCESFSKGLEHKLTNGLFWQLCTAKRKTELIWIPQINKVGYVFIKDSRVTVYTWKITDLLSVLSKKSESR